MKKLWKDYPELIIKNDNGQFEYKISFLKRSKRLEYFLNLKIEIIVNLAQILTIILRV